MTTKIPSATNSNWKPILALAHDEARTFLLKPNSYCSLDLPPYIDFSNLIKTVHQQLDGKVLSDLRKSNPRDHDDINYTILHNKDGKYAWRPFQLIHPALYVSLVHAITEKDNWRLICGRFKQFATNKKICCLSLPVVSISDETDRAEQVSHWWHEVEQRSIELSLEYDYLFATDITDCYGAIYTHSIVWALHTKDVAKKKESRTDKRLIGNLIDAHIQDMRHGQTNGIPQGSVLMDFVAEMVLGLGDVELSDRLQTKGIKEYKILRYRDDYRIFVNNSQDGETILKLITETTANLGLKLNPAKTTASNDVVHAAIKSDKLAWIIRKQSGKSLQKQLLIIRDHAINFPNAGSLVAALNDYHKRVSRITALSESPQPLIAIAVDIAYRNPRTYAICAAVLSKLLSFIESNDDRLVITKHIRKKFAQIPNTGHMQIWLQRVTFPLDRQITYDEKVCRLVAGETEHLWSNDWISSADLIKAVDATRIVDRKTRDEIAPVISMNEVELFLSKVSGHYY